MCGIAGLLGDTDGGVVKNMVRLMAHRGPDQAEVRRDGPLHLGMTRLAIVDPAADACVFADPSERYLSVANGEIYNSAELRQELRGKGYVLSTACDTEVIPFLFAEYGPAAIEKLDGIFAVAIWDRTEKVLHLARDRMGVKPLLYADLPSHGLAFASTFGAIFEHPLVRRSAEWSAIYQYLGLGYVPGDTTAYVGVKRVPPATMLSFSATGELVGSRRYWAYPRSAPESVHPGEVRERLWQGIRDAVSRQLMGHASIGVLVSGGLDSSAIALAMNEVGAPPAMAYCAGFDGDDVQDERSYARQVAQRLGNDYEEVVVTASEVPDLLELAIDHLEEPTADVSALPLLKICQRASSTCRVLLSGEGGDELLGGYDTYRAYRWAKLYRKLPKQLTRVGARSTAGVARRLGRLDLDFRITRLAAGASLPMFDGHFHWREVFSPEARRELLPLLNGAAADGRPMPADDLLLDDDLPDLERLLRLDSQMYLTDDLLVKADRMGMASSIEIRVPMTDLPLIEQVCGMGAEFRTSQVGWLRSRTVLRSILAASLPPSIAKRSKQGFSVPMSRWFRGELKGYMLEVLNSSTIVKSGVLHRDRLVRLADRHMAGQEDNWWQLWTALCLAIWYERQLDL